MKFSFVSLILIILYTFCINGTSGWWFRSLQLGCVYNGSYYSKGDTIGQTYDPETDTCIEYICRSNLKIVSVSTQNCHGSSQPTTATQSPSTSPPTSTPMTTPTHTVPTTTPSGCYYNGQFHPPNTEISSGQEGSWCYFTFCDTDGQVISGDDWNCGSSTTTPTSTSTPTVPTTTPLGCFYNGQHYPPNTEISSGQEGNWCFFTFCDTDGQVISGDDWNCGPSTTTIPPWTTEPNTAEKRFQRVLEKEITALLKKRKKHQRQ